MYYLGLKLEKHIQKQSNHTIMPAIETLLASAVGYILKGATSSTTAETAKEDLLAGFWETVRPYFLEDITELEEKADAPETATKVSDKLLEIIEKDEAFFKILAEKVNALKKAEIKEKNVVKGSIRRVKKIVIGHKEYDAKDNYNRMNIVEGDVEDADEFILGGN